MQNAKTLLYFLLNDIGDKFDAIALKSFVDHLFKLSEKILIHFPTLLSFYIEYYDDIIDHEIQFAQITSKNSVLHVGCGSIPASSILLNQKTNASIIGIDKDKDAVKHAKTCISYLDLSDKIDITAKNAFQMDFSTIDTILISQGITPKQEFLKTLSEKITHDHLVILRSFSFDDTLDSNDQFLTRYYTVKYIYPHTNHGTTISIFLRKKEKTDQV